MSHHSPLSSTGRNVSAESKGKTMKTFIMSCTCGKDCDTRDFSEGLCPSCSYIKLHPGEPVPKVCKVKGCARLSAPEAYLCPPCGEKRSQAIKDHEAEIQEYQLALMAKNKESATSRTLSMIGDPRFMDTGSELPDWAQPKTTAKPPSRAPAAAGSAGALTPQVPTPLQPSTLNTLPQQVLGNWPGLAFTQGQGTLPVLQRLPPQVAGTGLPVLPSGSFTQVPGSGQTLAYGLQGPTLLNQSPFLTAAVTGQGTSVLGAQTGLLGTQNLGIPGSSAGVAHTNVLGTMVPGTAPFINASGSQAGLLGAVHSQVLDPAQSRAQQDSTLMPPPRPPYLAPMSPPPPPPRGDADNSKGRTSDQGGSISSHVSRRDRHKADMLADRPVLRTGGTKSKTGHGRKSSVGSVVSSTTSRAQQSHTPPGGGGNLDDGVDPDDSVSTARKRSRSPRRVRNKSPRSSESESSSKSTSPPPKRKAFINMIRGMDKKQQEEEIELHAEPDAMQDMFGSAKAYKKGKPQDEGISLSAHQRQIMESILHRKDTKKLPQASGRKGIDLSEDTYKQFLRTPKLNPEAADYLGYLNRPKPKKDSNGNVVTPKATVGLKDKVGKEADADFQRIDTSARAGMRQTVYNQWLITSLKKILLVDLSKIEHPLAKEGSELHSIFDELFESSSMQLHDFARSAAVCTMARRKIVMNEIRFDQDPHEKALYLPMDSEGEFLFGKQVDKEGESVGFEDIAPDFANKMTALRDAKSALKDPNALRLPAGLPKDNPNKQSDYKSDNRPGLNRSNKKKKQKNRSFDKRKVERKYQGHRSPSPDRSYRRDYDKRNYDRDQGRGRGKGSHKQQPFQGKGGWGKKH